MKPTKPNSASSARPPPQHHVPALGVQDLSHDYDADDQRGPYSPATYDSATSPQRHLPAPAVVSRRDVDHPLRGSTDGVERRESSQVVIGTPSVGRVSPTSRCPAANQSSGSAPRTHSPGGYDSDASSQLPSAPRSGGGGGAAAGAGSIDAFPVMKPMKQHSVIVTEGKRYKPVADDLVPNRSFHPFAASFCVVPSMATPAFGREESRLVDSVQDSSMASVPAGTLLPAVTAGHADATPYGHRDNIVKAYLRGDTGEDQPMDAHDPMNNYTFFVGASEMGEASSRSSSSSSSSSTRSRDEDDAQGNNGAAHVPFGTPSLGSIAGSTASKSAPSGTNLVNDKSTARKMDVEEAEKFVQTLKRSFALQRNRSGVATQSENGGLLDGDGAVGGGGGSPAPLENLRRSIALQMTTSGGGGGGPSDASFALKEERAADSYMRQPMHEALRCVSRENLDDDTVSFKAVWESLKSETLSRNILFGFRVTLFAVFPTFLLTEHPKTKTWFVAGSLLPIISALFVRPSLGAMVFMCALALQSVMFFMTWGVLMNAVGAVNNMAGWWCGVIFSVFATAMFGELPSKRLLMVYAIIIMQTEHSPGGETLLFPCRFALDFTVAAGFALLATILPFPTFTYRQANEGIAGLHKLYCAGIGNAMKSFWAPVPMDAKMALSQIPFQKISGLTASVKMAIHFTTYEPTEFNLNNTLRGQRLAMLQRIKMHVYAMSAASAQRLANTRGVHRSQVRHEIKEFERRMQAPAMALAGEIMTVLVQIGAHIAAEDVTANVSFDAMAEKAMIFSDLMERERLEMLFLRKLPEEETNACLRCFAFHFSLLDIAHELQGFEQAMKNFDPAKYPSLLRRAYNFFFLDLWNGFWEELPHRLTLDRPYDVRLFKDAIRYTGAFAVACAFTLNYDRNNVYYFGMAILVRLAQQTASETLAIGVNRICGLCIGASLAYITHNKTHNVAEMVLLTMVWSFVSMCFSQHPVYGFGAQYVLVTSIAGLRLAPTPALLLTRITDNVFAFISYYIICTFIFPVDPIRVLWNTRTKCYLSMNDLAQTIVSIGCAPITMDGKEVDFLVAKARASVGAQQLLLKSYADWMVKSATEPTLRGGEYPASACSRLRLTFYEIASLEEALVAGVTRLHRPRDQPPSVVLRDMMELTRPFLLDAGRLTHQIFQSMIDATERHATWSMEEPLHLMWKSQLACRSLHHVTGNMQRNFYAAVQQVAAPDKEALNVYLNSSAVEDALMKDSDPSLLINKDNEDLVQRILAMSFHMSKDAVVARDDLQAFNAIIIVFELLLKTLAELLPPMIEIYEFEKSRHINVFKK